MRPLMEIFLNNDDQRLMSALQEETGLDQEGANKALSAILPAFSTGLKRQASNPDSLEKFMAALSSGRHAAYAENPQTAFENQNQKDGNGILGHLFGSKDVSRSIAINAASASGIDEKTIKQALPSLANLVMGGLFKQANAQIPAKLDTNDTEPMKALGGGLGGAILGQIMEQMMKKGTGRGQSSSSNNPLNDILEQITGGSGQRGRSSGSTRRGGGNPMNDAFQDMLAGKKSEYKTPKASRRQRIEPEDRYAEKPGSGFEDIGSAEPGVSTPRGQHKDDGFGQGGLGDLFGDMLESGSQEPKEYQRGIESIFDQFMGSNKR